VRGRETLRDLERVLDRSPRGERPALEELAKSCAFEQLGDGVANATLGLEIVDCEDVWMGKCRDRFRLALESRERSRIGREASGRTLTATSRSSRRSRAR
jgi:hypothetical protein